MRKALIILLQIVFALGIIGSSGRLSAFASSAEEEPSVVILFTGEYSGNFEDSDTIIGMDIVASMFEEQKANTPATFLLDCGDTVQGTFFCNYNEGEAAIDIMNTVGYDAMTLGNHEFDYGYDRLLELAQGANFPFLTQPSVFRENEPLAHTVMIERGGYKIGIFGLTTPATKQISTAFDTDFGNPSTLIEYAKKSAKSLRENGADIVICLSHIGNSDNFSHDYGSVMDISEGVLGIDVIIDGHSDNNVIHSSSNTPIVLTEGGNSIGVIKFYEEGGRFTLTTEMLDKSGVEDIKSNAETQAVIDKWKEQTDTVGREVIGVSGVAVADYEKGVIRERESALGNLVADAVKEASGADIAFINGGNIRAPLNEGDITWADVNYILPYSNYILTAKVKGSVIRGALENSAALRGTENAGGFLQVSGLSYSFDPALPEYSRITSITTGGEALDDERMYLLAVPDFIANGGDGYYMLQEAFADSVSKGDLTTVFAEYLKINGENISSELAGRIVIQDSKDAGINRITVVIAIVITAVIAAVVITLILKRKRNHTEK